MAPPSGKPSTPAYIHRDIFFELLPAPGPALEPDPLLCCHQTQAALGGDIRCSSIPSREHKRDLWGKSLKRGGFCGICHETPDVHCPSWPEHTYIHPSHMVLRSPVTYMRNTPLVQVICGKSCTYIQMFTTSTRNREEKLKMGRQML